MARTTRSAAHQDGHLNSTASTAAATSVIKKRKRVSSPIQDDQPAPKQIRTEPPQEEIPEKTISVEPEKAQKILDVLEMIDVQGLLDRVFPLPSTSQNPSSSSYSLRNLLKDPSNHPLPVLQFAINQLRPLSTHARSRISTPAAQQLRFCNLATSLLTQAVNSSVQIPLDTESVIPLDESSDVQPFSSSSTKPKYALVQHLPQGDYWTSLAHTDDPAIKTISTGNAELVSILPSAYETSLDNIPTLGSYSDRAASSQIRNIPRQRKATHGSFLDYGVWSSFAPTFEHDGAEVGREQLGEVMYQREMKKREWEKQKIQWMIQKEKNVVDVPMDTSDSNEIEDITMDEVDLNKVIDEVVPEEEADSVKEALLAQQLEQAVQELLGRNERALERLHELQELRLKGKGGGTSVAEEGSEEWDTAQGILESLSVLASLRPRTSDSSLIPPPSVLHSLHRTIPLSATPGWHGTLPPSRTTALRDDSTIRVRTGVTQPTPAPPPTTPAQNVSSYSYAYTPQGQGQRVAALPGSYPQYKVPVNAAAFYPSQPGAQYYAQAYAAAASGQQTYSYGSWYNSTNGTNSYVPTAAAGTAPSYNAFFNNVSTPPSRTTAVANTVVPKTVGQWPVQAGTVPTLPSHLRVATNGAQYSAR